VKIRGKLYSPHRIAYALEHGSVPDGALVCHRCDNPPCCNAAHLFAGSAKDNVDDMARKGRRGRQGAKLKPEQALAIFTRYAAGETNKTRLGGAYGISGKTVLDIVRGKVWAKETATARAEAAARRGIE
jgi:hypothetical protein